MIPRYILIPKFHSKTSFPLKFKCPFWQERIRYKCKETRNENSVLEYLYSFLFLCLLITGTWANSKDNILLYSETPCFNRNTDCDRDHMPTMKTVHFLPLYEGSRHCPHHTMCAGFALHTDLFPRLKLIFAESCCCCWVLCSPTGERKSSAEKQILKAGLLLNSHDRGIRV